MRIIFICEPRSGSTMLARWFHEQGEFDVRWESFIKTNSDWVGGQPSNYTIKKEFKYLILKEVYYTDYEVEVDWIKFIDSFDKVVFLYREDKNDQLKSWNYSVETHNWCQPYEYNNNTPINIAKQNYFFKLKDRFTNFRLTNKHKGFTISYEDLYVKGKIGDLKAYLNLPHPLDRKFPEGQRLRYSKIKNTKLI